MSSLKMIPFSCQQFIPAPSYAMAWDFLLEKLKKTN
jgi:hypothetical protein